MNLTICGSFDSSGSRGVVAFRFVLATLLACLAAVEGRSQTARTFSDKEIATALTYKARQDVDYDFKVAGRPPAEMVEQAQMQSSAEKFGKSGYIIADATNRVVRVLIDSNKDRKLDFFSYYKDGIEVYREVDTDFDSEPNEYRWMGSAGTRWGIDRNQDGEIDSWKVISAEEVAYEVFMAIKTRDDDRYQRLLITDSELKSLGLKGNLLKDAIGRLEQARKGFANMVRSQKTIDGKAEWINSGNGKPALASASRDLSKDLICYDHASSVFQSSAGTDTLALGTLVQIGDVWRLMELPQVVPRGKPIENGGLLFPVVQIIPAVTGDSEVMPVDEELAGFYEELSELESSISENEEPGAAMAKLQKDRAMLQWKIYQKIPADEKVNWLENIGDTVSYAYQQELYPEGLAFLESVIKTLRQNNKPEGLDYIRWRMIHADYYLRLAGGDDRDDEEAAKDYYEELQKFAKEFSKSGFAPESLFGIARNFEVRRSADKKKAVEWYRKCAQMYGNSDFGKRAAGAVARLTDEGRPVPFKGTTVDGKVFDITNRTLRDRVVVVYFWEMWCAGQQVNAKGDTAFEVFQDLKSKYKDRLVIVSANIEAELTLDRYREFDTDLSGIFQMHSPGGMENSPLAAQLGVVTEPMMVVWDTKGNLHDSSSGVRDLGRILQKLLP